MRGAARVGVASTVLTLLVGVWLFVAPFVVDYQDRWRTLSDATLNDMWSGAVLAVLAALTLLAVACLALRDAVRRERDGG
ncbi:hypothetical protein RxyAA322_29760 [Rubrobacter xylanophilus]|uniref:SPW repeat-containing integral membrane domain-containing protein n=1 Tax=Rubrobacter xylanophilus TaxID=49319 RepID=A0A510HMA9_9ACTN|nr:SPW repeat protein [Rubrobacter xylanophilus]BBL81122.1 hypothetical protein RxyAA322_29760 [Rubrobacter xylanophilus]